MATEFLGLIEHFADAVEQARKGEALRNTLSIENRLAQLSPGRSPIERIKADKKGEPAFLLNDALGGEPRFLDLEECEVVRQSDGSWKRVLVPSPVTVRGRGGQAMRTMVPLFVGEPADTRPVICEMLRRWRFAQPVQRLKQQRREWVRDHMWLDWYEAEGQPTHHSYAKIRDRWNYEHPDCKIAVAGPGADVVKKGIRKARGEREKEQGNLSIP